MTKFLSIFISLFFLSAIASSLCAQPHPYRIRELHFVGANSKSELELAATFSTKQGDTLNNPLLESDIQNLMSEYAKNGYVFAVITIERLQPIDSNAISIRIRVSEGKQARLVDCKPIGIIETDTAIIRREFFLGDYPIATQDLLEGAASSLRRSGLFSEVGAPMLYKISDSTVGVSLTLREAPSTIIDGVLGYNPPPSSLKQAYINGFLDLSFLNIGGSARQAMFRYQRLTPSSSELQFTYIEPWIFSLPVDPKLSLYRYDEDSLYTATHLDLLFSLHSLQSITLSIGAMYDIITPGALHIVGSSNTISGGLQFAYDVRDDPIALQHGFRIVFGANYGSKSLTDSNQFQSTGSIRTLSADAEAAVPSPVNRLVCVATLSFKQTSSSALERSDLFKIGGLSSLRGYRDASFLASQYAIGKFEIRYMLAKRSYFGAFFDAGFLDQVAYQSLPSQRWYPVGYGMTFLFETGIGYVQAAVALGRGQSFDQAVLHFGLKTSF